MTVIHKSDASGIVLRARRFCQKPWDEKANSARFRWAVLRSKWAARVSKIPIPVRLSFGALWIFRNDNLAEPLLAGNFERAEIAFVERFLQTGMTVLDLGAHHGLYTLLASKLVGSSGRVIAFEPSPRERRALRLHLILNRCKNVSVQGMALGDEDTQSDLYLVEAWAAGCNSLRPPEVPASTTQIRVHVTRLDEWLQIHKLDHIDFIKLDVEGGELSVLKGAECLLERRPRPVILAEVQDVRTRPWGYQAKEIITQLSEKHFRWFRLSENGSLQCMDKNLEELDGNFVAWPEEVELMLREV